MEKSNVGVESGVLMGNSNDNDQCVTDEVLRTPDINKWTCACHTKCSNKFPFQPTALHPVIAALKAQVKIYGNAFVLAIDTLKWPQTMIPNVLLICNCNSGLYVLSSEPVKMPWFDSIYADISDEQSLSQSLSIVLVI
ncbi:hypothetical protein Tco_0727344 [Tanacetum coccineum]|uniref:Uncharacterized protein n=1 Tax=Tanacetum coccineum TaxID=301880 RepID=A0ABQ4YL46_9ASTR